MAFRHIAAGPGQLQDLQEHLQDVQEQLQDHFEETFNGIWTVFVL